MKDSNIKISVLMSVYKEKEIFLREAIESIIAQTYSNIQFVIILDAPNNTAAEQIILEYQKKDDRIVYIKNSKNLGLAMSLNKGLELCRGEYIARMDADDIAMKNRLQLQLEYATKNNIDILGGKIAVINEVGNIIFEAKSIPTYQKAVKSVLRTRDCIAHPTWFVKRDVYMNLSGYRKIDACEDYDFLLRSLLAGYNIQNIDRLVLKYRVNGNGISQTNKLRQYASSIYLKKCFFKKREADVADLENYINNNLTEEIINNFSEAANKFKRACDDSKYKNIVSAVCACLRSRLYCLSLVSGLIFRIKLLWYSKLTLRRTENL